MLLIKKNGFELASASRLVKAVDVAAVRTAEETIAAAEAEATRLRETAAEAFENERLRGYKQGLEEGRAKLAADKIGFVYESAKHMAAVEEKLADVVIKALWKCVSQIGDRHLVMEIIRKLMKAVIHNQRHVTLKVAPEMRQEVRARLDEILADYPALEHVDVEEDSRLKGAAAILETEAGIADASVESQLAAIESSIRRHFSKSER